MLLRAKRIEANHQTANERQKEYSAKNPSNQNRSKEK